MYITVHTIAKPLTACTTPCWQTGSITLSSNYMNHQPDELGMWLVTTRWFPMVISSDVKFLGIHIILYSALTDWLSGTSLPFHRMPGILYWWPMVSFLHHLLSPTCFMYILTVMVVIGNKIGNQSSNSGWGSLHFT